jgi:p-hydroxybenzoate 3-monooxygenase
MKPVLGRVCLEGGTVHHSIELVFKNTRHPIEVTQLTGGKVVTAYGQTEVTKDLMAQRVPDWV